MPTDLTLSTIVRRSPEPVTADVDETIVMMSIARANYYSLEGVGARVWQLIDVPRSVSHICEALEKEFAVEPEECRKEVLDFLRHLLAEGLIETEE